MRTSWEALGARARGLAAHLLADDKLSELERGNSVAEFLGGLEGTPYAPYMPARGARSAAIDLGVTRSLADRIGRLARWAGPGGHALLPVFWEQDVRNVRAIVRGVIGELAPQQRVEGAIPTPTLGRRELEVLSRAESARAVASALALWAHPLGSFILSDTRRARPEPLRLEAALGRWWVEAATASAIGGGEEMRRFVTETVDSHNLVMAVLLAGARSERSPEAYFVEGGDVVRLPDFARAATAHDRLECVDVLVRATRRSLYEEPLRGSPATPAGLSARLLEARIARLARERRRDPLTAGPVVLFVLRLRREARRVRRALWTASLAQAVSR